MYATELPYILSFACYMTIHIIGKRCYKHSNSEKEKQFILSLYECMASNIIIIVFLSLNIHYVFLEKLKFIEDFGTSWLLTYFVIDLVMISKITRTSAIHHIFGWMIIIRMKTNSAISYDLYAKLGMIEISTVFLNLRIILKDLIEYLHANNRDDIRGYIITKIAVEYMFAISFIIGRGICLPILFITNVYYITLIESIGFGGLVAINLYWCKLIIDKLRKE